MKNSIIAVANWKGGCGKSLISALLCHYLHMKEIPVMGVDAVKQLSKAKIIFVPNRINLNEEKSAKIEQEREEARKILNKHGWMTPRIKQSLTVRQYSTIEPLSYYQRKLVEHTFDQIIERINI